jgi:hypothetical protein
MPILEEKSKIVGGKKRRERLSALIAPASWFTRLIVSFFCPMGGQD